MDRRRLVRRAHFLVRMRLVGWMLIGAWQVLSLTSEFVPLVDIESKPVRVMGKLLGLAGLIMIAYGFEKLSEVSHRLSEVHE